MGVKKKTAARRPTKAGAGAKAKAKAEAGAKAKVAAGAPAVAQSAAERRAAEAELKGLIDTFTPTQLSLIAAMRRSLRKRLPTVHEVVYEYRDCFVISYSPSGHGYEGVLGIRGSADGVRLYFNGGKDLPDPEGLLQGAGGMARWVAVEGVSTLARPAVAGLIAGAIERAGAPFAASGTGSVVVRPTTARKRSGRS